VETDGLLRQLTAQMWHKITVQTGFALSAWPAELTLYKILSLGTYAQRKWSCLMLVNNEFLSVQGTGHLLGTPQYFVRTAGCSVACPIRAQCDEREALSKHNGVDCGVDEIVDRAVNAVGQNGWIHITGGEPADQADEVGELIKAAQKVGMKCHLQTSGVFNWEVRFDWITVSPKVSANDLAQRYGNEMCLIYTGQSDEELVDYARQTSFWHYYLVPLWDGKMSNAREACEASIRLTSLGVGPRHFSAQEWLVGIQAHKFWGVE
tara:strand:+ start:75 stop:866 length:792 start_codon:yes stop_codon:yes gene_type:complete